MRNKCKFICCGIIIALFCLSGNISHASEKQYIVEFNDSVTLHSATEDLAINVLSESELEECLEAGIVEWYEEDFVVELLDSEAPQLEAQSENLKWDLEMINAGRAKEILCEGQEINVGIIDSGIMNHPDIVNNIKQGHNYLNSSTDVSDNIGHGTFVAGMIAAEKSQNGVCGIADETNLIPLKCFDSGKTTTVSTICSAIRDAVDVYDCDIINMSLGLADYSETLKEYVKYATDAGVIVVAAVGNKGTSTLYYPAAYENVIGVGSINSEYVKSSFSQYNSSVDFLAPGENVWSTSNDGAYKCDSGTSFSAPLVSGLVAIMLSVDNDLSHDEIVALLADTATVRDEWSGTGGTFERNNNYGYGMVNVSACLNEMLKDHTYFISPIDFEEGETQVAIVNNSGAEFAGYCMWGEYTARGMLDMDWEYVVIPVGGYVIADTNLIGNKIKCFLWRNVNDIAVIADFKERQAG